MRVPRIMSYCNFISLTIVIYMCFISGLGSFLKIGHFTDAMKIDPLASTTDYNHFAGRKN